MFVKGFLSFVRPMLLLLGWFLSLNQLALADDPIQHNGVGRVYEPYVNALEREFEYRSLYQTDDKAIESDILRQKLGYGFSVGSKLFAEAYIAGKKRAGESFRVESFELEARWQLTEQGEFAYDWGLLFELEKERSESITELSSAVLISRQWGRWVGTANLGIEYEFGSDIDNEFDTFVAAKLRYRYKQYLEPGIELYIDEITSGVGPVFSGLVRGRENTKWQWEVGLVLPLNNQTPDYSYRFLLEFEF